MTKSHHLALIILWLPFAAWGQAGEVRFAQGEVQVQRANGSLERLARGTRVEEGDTLITGSSGHIQVALVDQAVIAVRPNTRLKLDTYRYSGAAASDANDRGIFSLIRGSFRSITGLIGQKNKSAYSVRTPTATIGIRGTDHEPLVIPLPGPGETPIGEPGTYDKVNSGSTVIETSGGTLEVRPNQVGFASARPGSPPIALPQIPPFMRSTPPAQPNQPGPGPSAPQSARPPASAPPPPPPPPPPPGSDATGLPALPPPPLAPLPQQGSIDPNSVPADAKGAPIGTVLSGGDLSGGSVGSGSGIVGDPNNNFAVLLDGSNNPIAISSTGFNYSRDNAPLVDQGSAMVGSNLVNWGIYAGGAINDGQGLRYPQYFHFMIGGEASTSFSLMSAMPNVNDTYYFSGVAGFTKPIAEGGAIGGTVDIYLTLKNLGGAISVYDYNVQVDDALGRTWNGTLISPQGLATFTHNPGQNLSVTCGACPAGVASGQASGMAIGNPISGFVTSYSMTKGGAGVTGAAVVLPSM